MGGGGGSSMTIPNVSAGTLDPNQIIQQYAASTDYLKPILNQAATQLQTNIDYANKIGQPFTDTSLAAIDQMRSLAGMQPTTQSQQAASTAFGKTYTNIAENTGNITGTPSRTYLQDAGYTKSFVQDFTQHLLNSGINPDTLNPQQTLYYANGWEGAIKSAAAQGWGLSAGMSGGPILSSTDANGHVTIPYLDAQYNEVENIKHKQSLGLPISASEAQMLKDSNPPTLWNKLGNAQYTENIKGGLTADSMKPLQDLQKKFDALSSAPNNVEYQKQYAAIQNQFNDYKNSVQYDINNYQAMSQGQAALPKPDGLSYVGVTGLNYQDTRQKATLVPQQQYLIQQMASKLNNMSDAEVMKMAPAGATTQGLPLGTSVAQSIRNKFNAGFVNNILDPNAFKGFGPQTILAQQGLDLNSAGAQQLMSDAQKAYGTYTTTPQYSQSFADVASNNSTSDRLKLYNQDVTDLTSQFGSVMSNLPSSMLDPMNADQLQQYVMSLPGFKTQFQAGAQGLQRAQAAKGKLASGQGLLESQNYAQDAIQTAYQNQMNNLAATAGIGLPFQNQQTGSSAAQSEAIRQAAIGAPLLTSDFNTASANARINAQQFNSQNSMQAAIANQSGQLEMAKILAESKGGNPGPVSGYNYQSQGPITNAGSAYFSGLF